MVPFLYEEAETSKVTWSHGPHWSRTFREDVASGHTEQWIQSLLLAQPRSAI